MKRKIVVATGVGIVAALSLTACSGGSSEAPAQSGPVTLSMSGWSLSTTPEFQALADKFHEENPDITVEVKEYDSANYDTLMTADLAAGSGPDIITQKNLKTFITYQAGGQLADVSDVELPGDIGGAQAFEVDGATWAVPYRQDSWVLFYNKDLFTQAGVAEPDGSWTWDDYEKAAEQLTSKLGAAGSAALGTYQHSWQSTVQGFANAQSPDVDILAGDYGYLKPYYERSLALQSGGDQVEYNTVTANKLTYQAEFGKQQAAMMPMAPGTSRPSSPSRPRARPTPSRGASRPFRSTTPRPRASRTPPSPSATPRASRSTRRRMPRSSPPRRSSWPSPPAKTVRRCSRASGSPRR